MMSRKLFLQLGTCMSGSLLIKPFVAGLNFGPMANTQGPEKKEPELRTIPSTGEKIPAIGMGTWLTFDAGNSESRRKELKEVLRIFWANGGKLIDSSPMYGSSEKVVGDLLTDLKIRTDLFLATKVWTNGETS